MDSNTPTILKSPLILPDMRSIDHHTIWQHLFIHIMDESSMQTKFSYGVPLGSVLGPMLFILYTLSLANIREHSINFHWYVEEKYVKVL